MKLKQSAIRGFLLVSLSSAFIQGTQFLTKIILARILLPADFGLVALALVVINALSLINDFGGGTAIIHFKKRVEDVVNTSFLITSSMGVIFFILLYLSSGLIANFFGQPDIGKILRMLSVVFILAAPSSVIKSRLSKELRFNKIIIAEAGSTFLYALVTILMALNGFGVWSLVWGYLVSVTSETIIILAVSKYMPRFYFDAHLAKKLFHYGKFVIGSNMIGFIVLQGDNAIVGKVLNSTSLGYYVMAYGLANLTSTQIVGVISRVMFPVFSKLQNDFKRLRSAYLNTMGIVAFFSMPFIFGTAVLAVEFIEHVLGSKWGPIKYPLYILLLFGFFRSIMKITGYFLQAIGKPRLHAKFMFYEMVGFMLLVIPLTIRYGIIGTSISVTIPMFIGALISILMTNRILGLKFYEFLRQFYPSLLSSFAMALSILLIKKHIFIITSLVDLIVIVVFGALIYMLSSFFIDKDNLANMKDTINSLVGKK